MQQHFSTVSDCIKHFQNGGMLIVMDDEDRENEGDLFLPAQSAAAENVAFILRHTTGILCVAMPHEWSERLALPQMVQENNDPHKTAFTVSCDHQHAGTGVSATNRALTIKALADPTTQPQHLRRPGHIFPLVARAGGVLQRRGHTEAAVDFCKLAGFRPVGLLSELQNDDGTMMRLDDCIQLSKKFNIPITTVEHLAQYRQQQENVDIEAITPSLRNRVEIVAECDLPIKFEDKNLGKWKVKAFLSHKTRDHHIVLIKNQISGSEPVLTRIHSECFTGDTLGSLRCDCGGQLRDALTLIHEHGSGIVMYVAGHEGRGIGLVNKIKAYNLQINDGLDTYQANACLGFGADHREYADALSILQELGIQQIKLLSNNPEKQAAFSDITAEVVPLTSRVNEHNLSYLKAKEHRRNQIEQRNVLIV